MPYVEFVCVKCGHNERCVSRIYSNSFDGLPTPPLCFQGLTDGIDEYGEPKDKAHFEYTVCRLDKI